VEKTWGQRTQELELNFQDSINAARQLVKQGYVVEAVKMQRESCSMKHFNPHGCVVLKLRPQKGEELFFRVDWEPDGWRTQQQAQESNFEPYFGSLSENGEEGNEEEEKKLMFTAACKTALEDMWDALREWQREKPTYNREWNSLEAAKELYQRLIQETADVGSTA